MHVGKINQCYLQGLMQFETISAGSSHFFVTLVKEMNFIIYFVAYCLSVLFEYQA